MALLFRPCLRVEYKYCNCSSLFSYEERRNRVSTDYIAHTPCGTGFPSEIQQQRKLIINKLKNLRMSGHFVQGLLILATNAIPKDNMYDFGMINDTLLVPSLYNVVQCTYRSSIL
jgi:hypothetical protein